MVCFIVLIPCQHQHIPHQLLEWHSYLGGIFSVAFGYGHRVGNAFACMVQAI